MEYLDTSFSSEVAEYLKAPCRRLKVSIFHKITNTPIN